MAGMAGMAGMASMASKSARRRGERGSALVLAILILFAMLGLGLLAMRTATQNVAGSGNLRLNKQARAVAEVGLSAVIAALKVEAHGTTRDLLAQWQNATLGDGSVAILVNDRGRARLMRLDEDGEPVGGALFERDLPVRELLSGADPLGAIGAVGGMVTSFEVRVEGMKFLGQNRPGNEVGSGNAGSDDGECLIHLTARGSIATAAIGDEDFEEARDDARSAEYSLRAGVIVTQPGAGVCQSQALVR